MNNSLKLKSYICGILLTTFMFAVFTWSTWGITENTVTSYVVASLVAILMTCAFFIWPLMLGLGKGAFSKHWAKAAHKSMWTTKGIWHAYLKRNWLRFILHAICAGIFIFVIFIASDLIMLDTLSYTINRLMLAGCLSLIFCGAVATALICRYMLYLCCTHNVMISKNM